MSEPILVSDLELDDEHDTVSTDTTITDATKKLLSLQRGILVVLNDDSKVQGFVSSLQVLQAVAEGENPSESSCGNHMDTDVMEVNLSDSISDLAQKMAERRPHAIVAVDDSGNFSGYFSPNDYREALARTQKTGLDKLVGE